MARLFPHYSGYGVSMFKGFEYVFCFAFIGIIIASLATLGLIGFVIYCVLKTLIGF